MDLYQLLTPAVPSVTPGAVAMLSRAGQVVDRAAVGEAVRYRDPAGALASERPPVTLDTLFDLASVTKLYTTTVVLRLGLDLDAPIGPGYTLRALLTHTAGLPATVPEAARSLSGIFTLAADGTARYSDVGLLIAGFLAEQRAGARLDELVRELITVPLGLTGTTFEPDPARCAATEFKPNRGMIRGAVHDETAFRLGVPCGHAGLFAPAGEVLAFADALRTGFAPGIADLPNLTTRGGFGHTGFTGTSVLITERSAVVLLTNRVHPRRERSSVDDLRTAVADHLLHVD